jgi:ATP-dependent helicase HrpA
VPVHAYPALTAEAKGVALRLYRTPEEAQAALVRGRSALFELALRHDLAWLHRDLRALSSLGADLALVGGAADLREDAYASLRSWLVDREIVPPTAAGFAAAVARAREDLKGLVPRCVALVGEIARLRQELLVEKHPYPGLGADLERLVPPGFLRSIPFAQLAHLPRYLKAMALRAAKRRQQPARDDARAAEVAPFAAAAAGRRDGFSWLVEEFRVSLFAQELGTAVPVSRVKLERARAGTAEQPEAGATPAPVPAASARPLERPAKLKNLRALDGIFPR